MKQGMWRHMSCLDMDLYIVRITYKNPKYIKARVVYINRHNGKPLHAMADTVKINTCDFYKWSFISNY